MQVIQQQLQRPAAQLPLPPNSYQILNIPTSVVLPGSIIVAVPNSSFPVYIANQQQQQQQQQQQLQAETNSYQQAAASQMQQGQQAYMASLLRGHVIMARNWQAATNQQRDAQWEQLDTWSRQQLGRPAVQCTPDDLIVYLESSFIKQHGRQAAADGSSCPAPSTVKTIVSHLSTKFQQLGRRGTWDCTTGTGNPCDSMELRTFKGGYANLMQEQGFLPTSAKPISEAKLQQLVGLLVEEATAYQQLSPKQQQQQPWYIEALLRRDACIVQYLWDSKRRPAETGSLQTSQLDISFNASGDGQVQALPGISKMCHANRSSRRPKVVQVQGAAGQQLAELLLQYQQCLQRTGHNLGRFMFSPLRADKQGLQVEQGLSTAAMEQRVVGHLKRLQMYEGESLYSIKRGAMQHEFFINGVSLQAVGEAADIETSAVVRTYLDPFRHHA